MNKYLVFVGIGVELVGIICGCLYAGQKLDQIYNLKGLAMIGLSLAGLAGWLVQIVIMSKRLENISDDEPGNKAP